MKVRCRKLISATTNAIQSASPWLTVGKEYDVLAISIRLRKEILFQIIGDDVSQIPVLFDSKQFEITCDQMPDNWVVSLDAESNVIELAPSRWLRPGFWEDFFNGVEGAMEDFKSEAKKIDPGLYRCDP